MPTLSSMLATGSWLLAGVITLQVPPPVANGARSPELRGRRDEILAVERSRLQALADRLRAEGKAAEADRALPDPAEAPQADGSSRFVPLPEVVEAKPKGSKLGEIGPPGREAIRLEAARALFDLAVRAAKPPESFALADECLRGVIDRQPDHAEARRLLGFVPHRGGWATPFAARMLDEGSVYDATYGWVRGDWVPHLRQGELPAPGRTNRWLPADQADALRRDWATRWEITTEHFRISTNVPLNEAISFGRKLEDLHQLVLRDDGRRDRPNPAPARPAVSSQPDLKPGGDELEKIPIRSTTSRPATNIATIRLQPLLGAEFEDQPGDLLPAARSRPSSYGGISYFFNDVGGQLDVTSTLYHEASHQLLFESAGADDYMRNVGPVLGPSRGSAPTSRPSSTSPTARLRIGGLEGPRIAEARNDG